MSDVTVTPVLSAPVTPVAATAKVAKPVAAPKFTIFQSADGTEIGRKQNGRGRPRMDGTKLANGDIVIANCTLDATGAVVEPPTPSKVKADKVKAEKVQHFYILNRKNADGTFTEVSRTAIGRGKPKAGYVKDEATGNRIMIEGQVAAEFKKNVIQAPIAEEITEATPLIDQVATPNTLEPAKSDIVDPVIA